MLLDGYLSTLQLMKLMRLANILKKKTNCHSHTKMNATLWKEWSELTAFINQIMFGLWEDLYSKWLPQGGYRNKTACYKSPPISSANAVTEDVRNLTSEQTRSSGRYFTHRKWWRQKGSGLGPTCQARTRACSAGLSGHATVSQNPIKM